MKSMVALRETNDSVVEFDGNILPPLLLPSPKYDGYCFSCASIEHMKVCMSVFVFLIKSSNTVRCNFLTNRRVIAGTTCVLNKNTVTIYL